MFKLVIIFSICYVCSAAVVDRKLPVKNLEEPEEIVAIVKSVAEKKSDGSFIYSFEGADGTQREEVGIVKNPGTDDEELQVSGSYRYIDANGENVEVHYTADKNGFVAEGTNIPKEISDAAREGVKAAQLRAAKDVKK